MHEAFDLSPERSRIAWRDDRPIGLAMLAVRGARAWVGGMGVATEARRAGVGEQLMRALLDSARAAGVKRVQLEVLEANTRARLLYEKLGFRTLRRLEVWQWETPAGAPALAVEACDPRAARHRIAATRRAIEPWQREDATIDRLDVSTPALRAVRIVGAAGDAVYRVTDGRASVLQMAAPDERTAGALLDAMRGRAGVTVLRYL